MISERAKVLPYTGSCCSPSPQGVLCEKCCAYAASESCGVVDLPFYRWRNREARVLHSFSHSISHAFINMFMAGPLCAGPVQGREGAGLRLGPARTVAGRLLLQAPLSLPAAAQR